MRVKLRTRYAGPSGNFEPGRVADLPDQEAKSLVAGGYASFERGPEVETATAEPQAETASVKPSRKGK